MQDSLAYFYEWERIAKLFNEPGDGICLKEDFLSSLARLDVCLEFVGKNVGFEVGIF